MVMRLISPAPVLQWARVSRLGGSRYSSGIAPFFLLERGLPGECRYLCRPALGPLGLAACRMALRRPMKAPISEVAGGDRRAVTPWSASPPCSGWIAGCRCPRRRCHGSVVDKPGRMRLLPTSIFSDPEGRTGIDRDNFASVDEDMSRDDGIGGDDSASRESKLAGDRLHFLSLSCCSLH